MKTPEELAKKYVERFKGQKEILGSKIGLSACRLSFCAGYIAGQSQWIQVEKKLPEIQHIVLIYAKSCMLIEEEKTTKLLAGIHQAYLQRKTIPFSNVQDAIYWQKFGVEVDPQRYAFNWNDVTHWMPLPTPPEEEKK